MSCVDCFKVYSRCRPLNQKQTSYGINKKSINIIDEKTMTISQCDSKQSIFQFDAVFDDNKNNLYIFEDALVPLIENFVNGYNSTVFAYGITGAGKSFTMFGNKMVKNTNEQNDSQQEQGLIQLTFQYLLSRIQQDSDIKYKISYIQIYNEQVYDLLKSESESLQIIQDPNLGVYVNNLQEKQINFIHQAIQYIKQGNCRRVVAQTKSNQFSSRSHAIVLITMERKIDQKMLVAKFSLVDLAGSERQAAYQDGKGIRNIQGSNINRSLLTLGNCINILSQKKKNCFVPYRDSKLTRLLKDSLGGNTKTVMIACVSPSSLCYEETLNTLKYACRAKKIEKLVYQNIKDIRTIQQYKNQITRLKKENQMLKKKAIEPTPVNSTRQDNKIKQKKIRNIINSIIEQSKVIAKGQCLSAQSLKNSYILLQHQIYQSNLIKQLLKQCLGQNNNEISSIPKSSVQCPYGLSKYTTRQRPKSSIKLKQEKNTQYFNFQHLKSKTKKDKKNINDLMTLSVEGKHSIDKIKKNTQQTINYELISQQQRISLYGLQRGIFNQIKQNKFKENNQNKIRRSNSSASRNIIALQQARKIKDKLINKNNKFKFNNRRISQQNDQSQYI